MEVQKQKTFLGNIYIFLGEVERVVWEEDRRNEKRVEGRDDVVLGNAEKENV